MVQKVLITGGMGYVGSRLTPHLLALGHQVRVIDLCLYGDYGLQALHADDRWSAWEKRFSLVRGDIRHPHVVREAMQGVDAVVHLAAISNDPTGEVDDVLTRQVNFDAVGLLVTEGRKVGVKRFINASSSSVFGVKHDENVTEALEPEPLTSYSRYKALGEWVVRAAASTDFCTVNVRPATICGYSPRQRFDLAVNKLTADALRKGVITVHGGEQRRPNVGMTDMVEIYARLLEAPAEKINGSTFNFGFENHKLIELAKIIQDELSDREVRIDVAPIHDQRDYHISSERLHQVLGYEPKSSIRQEVRALRKVLETQFPDIDADRFYNMKTMVLARDAGPCAAI